MSIRATLTTVRSGQPRAYADSESVQRLSFERQHWKTKEWESHPVAEDVAVKVATAMPWSAYIPTRANERNHGLESYLSYFVPINPTRQDKPEVCIVSDTWEFRTVSPFCD